VSIEPDGQHHTASDLGEVLRKIRKAAGLSGERLAVRCAMSQPKISRIERGKQLPTVADVERILEALEVTSELADKIMAMARRANIEHVSVRALAETGLWRVQTELKHLTELCAVQRSFVPSMVSGLLQTPEYARAVLTPKLPTSPTRDVDKAVAARLDRQTVLDDTTRQFSIMMTEQAVRWKRMDRPGMAKQCEHLAEMSERPNLDLAIIPLTAQIPGSPLNSFLTFDDRMVIVELFTGEVIYRDYRDVKYHLDLYDLFYGHALTGDRARAFLLSARDEFM
jgi:transcriptional regulator with XRE-family HTH domain